LGISGSKRATYVYTIRLKTEYSNNDTLSLSQVETLLLTERLRPTRSYARRALRERAARLATGFIFCSGFIRKPEPIMGKVGQLCFTLIFLNLLSFFCLLPSA
jgi:hypothetical protein